MPDAPVGVDQEGVCETPWILEVHLVAVLLQLPIPGLSVGQIGVLVTSF